MPYVTCEQCGAQSYVALGSASEPCPVCGSSLRPPRRAASTRQVQGAEASASDAVLAARHRDGEAAAFVALHARHAPVLQRYATRLVGASAADDVVQEAFERAHRLLTRDERARSDDFVLGAWLRTVVHHRCIDELRRPGRCTVDADVELLASTDSPHDRVVVAERLERLRGALLALPERQRVALVRHAIDGEPHDAVARQLCVTVAATKSLVNRARRELRHTAAA